MVPLAATLTETELKLRIAPGAADTLWADALLKGGGRARTRRLSSTYFDTPDFQLWRNGVCLRMRQDGSRWLQTLKGRGSVQAGLHQRAEAEIRVTGPQPDISLFGQGVLADFGLSPVVLAGMRPVFSTELVRSSRVLALEGGCTVEASLDRGVIRSGKRSLPLCEVELELKAGEPQAVFDLARRLLNAHPLAVDNRSKAERGFALAQRIRVAPAKGRAAALSRAAGVTDTFKSVLDANLSHLLANEQGALQGRNAEFLHQMRVALRRLRSAIALFAPCTSAAQLAPLAAGAKWLAQELGPARDWDVFMTETLPPINAAFPEHAELEAFGRSCTRLRRAAHVRVRRAVLDSRYQRLLLDLGCCLVDPRWPGTVDAEAEPSSACAESTAAFAATVLEERYRKVRRRGRRLDTRSDAELHRLRIAVKKLRYAADFFIPLFDARRARALQTGLARLQDVLGVMNDAATVALLMQSAATLPSGAAAAEARGMVLGWSRGRALTLKRELRAAWKAFRTSERFW